MRRVLLSFMLALFLVATSQAGVYFGIFGTSAEVDDTCRLYFSTFDTLGHSADPLGDSVYILRFARGTLIDSTDATKFRNYLWGVTKKAYDGTNLGQYAVYASWRPCAGKWYSDDGYYVVEPETVSYARGDTNQFNFGSDSITVDKSNLGKVPVNFDDVSGTLSDSEIELITVKLQGDSLTQLMDDVDNVKSNAQAILDSLQLYDDAGRLLQNVDNIKTKTDNLPANPADQSLLMPEIENLDGWNPLTSGVFVDSLGDSLINSRKVKHLSFDSTHFIDRYWHQVALYSDSGNVGGAATDWTAGEKNQIRRSLGVTGDTASLTTYALPVWNGDYFGSRTITGDTYTPDVIVTTNNDKTGYSLTQTFPTNFSDLLISSDGGVYTDSIPDSLITGKKIKTLTFDSSHFVLNYRHMIALYSDSGNVGGVATDWTAGEKNQIRRSLGVTGDTASLTTYALPVWDGDYFSIRTLNDTTDTYQILFPRSGAYNKDSIQVYNSSDILIQTIVFKHNNTDAAYDSVFIYNY